ncbi:CotH protein [Desulfonispora thiosulfatigenes DSM 11270]|uniref:CotH protein n=1 Tax=Desulfonispora thiosulfatigenes DSM 11270 TaxID=656914 RepID=A0A1W1V777_DESTI|nr:CotH kinase family protein [Desulfonispora thiosulfatigenes]SMB89040.1 CotH protein [Desulfonispora thiosulfatigenes DSM 11270]
MKKTIALLLFALLIIILAVNLEQIIIGIKKIDVKPPFTDKNIEYQKALEDDFTTNLPVIIIDTKKQMIDKDTKTWAKAAVLEKVPGGKSILSKPDQVMDIQINYRGASSYAYFDKRQYRIKFFKDTNSTKELNYELAGMEPDSEWVLHGPFLDRTLMRNHLIYGLAGEIMDWAPDSRFMELFVNGYYQGVYLAVEPVTSGASRLRLNTFGLVSGNTPYIVKRERIDTEIESISTYGEIAGHTSQELSIEYPASKNLTHAQRKFIENDLSTFETVLYGDKFADPEKGYAKYIDVDSFVDYVIINEATMNYDAGKFSVYAYKDLNEKLKMTVWDFNNSYNHYQWSYHKYDQFFLTDSPWFDRLLQDRQFVEKVVHRYRELRKDILSTENIHQHIDDYQMELGSAIDRNFDVWGYSFRLTLLFKKGEQEREPRNYDDAILQLKTAIESRFSFLDENIEELYKNCVN